MRKVVVNEFMSLDGVAQAPGGADEDPSGGFSHGGWHMRYMEDDGALENWALGYILEAGGFLLGRRTWELFAGYWPNASEEQQGIAEPLNTKPKYVVSRTLTEPLEWQPSTLLQGELDQAISALKQDSAPSSSVAWSTSCGW